MGNRVSAGRAAFRSAMATGAVLLLSAGNGSAQPPAPDAATRFEVASIKVVDGSRIQIAPGRSGGRISWRTTLGLMVQYAYNVHTWQVIGLPDSDAFFQVDASAAASASTGQIRLMFQSLLADRFKLAAHPETRDVNRYVLTVAKGGLKLREVKPGEPPAPLPEWFAGKEAMIPQIEGKVLATMGGKGIAAVTGRGVSLDQLADGLSQALRTFVVDRTGVAGRYYFGFKFLRDDAPPEADAPTVAQAVQALGLRLERDKGPVEILVIDHLERLPTEN